MAHCLLNSSDTGRRALCLYMHCCSLTKIDPSCMRVKKASKDRREDVPRPISTMFSFQAFSNRDESIKQLFSPIFFQHGAVSSLFLPLSSCTCG